MTRECEAVAPAQPPSADQRRKASDLVARAQEAAIVADNATARDLYQRAAQLDPTNVSAVYALARTYETANDARAVTQYCRFLAIAPNSTEAPDVRQRIATVSSAIAARRASVRAAGVQRAPSPGAAFTLGVIFPGLGQYYTRQPVAGLFVTAAAAGAVYYATQSATKQITLTAKDPNGVTYSYLAPQTDHPNVAVGLGAAAGVSMIAAIAAYVHARGLQSADASLRAASGAPDPPAGASPVVVAVGSAIGLGLQIPLALHR